MPALTILDAMRDVALLAPHFPRATWGAWEAFLAALFGLDMSPEQAALFRRCTGRATPPRAPAREGWIIAGRRAGKSRVSALVAVFLACCRDYRAHLAPGEVGTVMLLAADRKQARVLMRYVTGILDGVPMLSQLVVNRTAESIELANRVVIEIATSSFRSTRGYTIVAGICDEVAYWRSEDCANPDTEIIAAIRPGMASIPGSLLLCISSPHARRGELWNTYRRHWAQDGPILVWQSDTRTMNPSVPEDVIREAYERDEAVARAEFGAQFRSDLEDFISREVLDAVVIAGRRELGPSPRFRYVGFVDPSGGSSDSMTLAIGHVQDDKVILDHVSEARPPFAPDDVVAQFAATLKRYNVRTVVGDAYAGEWPRDAFRRHGIAYQVSERRKSDLYRDVLPLLTGHKVELLDHPRLTSQLLALERRVSWGGKESIDHALGGAHDDVANAACGALVLAHATRRPLVRARQIFEVPPVTIERPTATLPVPLGDVVTQEF